RLLELEVLKRLYGKAKDKLQLFSAALLKIDVDQMYGIEIVEWPARIAEVAMWLIDHQMNLVASNLFGKSVMRLPLKKGAKIRIGNALQFDWNELLSSKECSYVLGNPPFVGAKFQIAEQKSDMKTVFDGVKRFGLLDYVAAWYLMASIYIKDTKIACAFVSTNSITQGEQVGVLWPALFDLSINIQFAHSTFNWFSEARGKARVHVVIVGFGLDNPNKKALFEYDDGAEQASMREVTSISPYLIEGDGTTVGNRSTQLCEIPIIRFGNQPIDGGHLILSSEDKAEMNRDCPNASKYIRRYVGSKEYIHNLDRYCLWLKDVVPSELKGMKPIVDRIYQVRAFRLASKRPATNDLASQSAQFAFVSHPDSRYLIIPSVSSERRRYIPIGFAGKNTIASNLVLIVPGATIFHFSILTSAMHMAWVRQVCGRMKSDFRYSNKLVYNNFPWPGNLAATKKAAVEKAAQEVLDARKEFKGQTLADLYDPLTMPMKLLKAHKKLDKVVDKCYRSQPFNSDRKRVEFLFTEYKKLLDEEQ
ncbi:MAG: type IIL restriction-modification enzyme MmeI, partial [Planctomycetota bacterium]